MMLRFPKLLLGILLAATFLLLFKPETAFACDRLNAISSTTSSSCSLNSCNPNNGIHQQYITYTYSDQSTCTQLEYFTTSSCSTISSNPCPAGCNPNLSDESQCNSGTCASGGLDATTVCNGNRGSGPYWCQGYNCGYNLLCEHDSNSDYCTRKSVGTGVGPTLDQCKANAQAQCAPTVTLDANPSSIPYEGDTDLSWNPVGNRNDSTSCVSDWDSGQQKSPLGGSSTLSNLTQTATYNLVCTNYVYGRPATGSDSATVTVAARPADPTNVCGPWSDCNCQGKQTQSCSITGEEERDCPIPASCNPPGGGDPPQGSCSISLGTVTSSSITVSVNGSDIGRSGRDRYSFDFYNSGGSITNAYSSIIGPDDQSLTFNVSSTTRVRATAYKDDGSLASVDCRSQNINQGGGSAPTPTTAGYQTPPGAQGLNCLRCSFAWDEPKWRRGTASENPGCQAATANAHPARENTRCFIQGDPPPEPGSQGVTGSFLIRNPDGSEVNTPAGGQANSAFPVWYWISSNRSAGYCGFRGVLNNTPMCFQETYYRNPDLAYWAPADPFLNQSTTNTPSNHFILWSWPAGFKPIGYYDYQRVITIEEHCDYACYDDRCFGDDDPYRCVSCGGGNCRSGDCVRDCAASKWKCEPFAGSNGNPYRVKSEFHPFGALSRERWNDVGPFCAPEAGNYARLDLVFQRDARNISGTVFVDTNLNGTQNGGESGYGGARVYVYEDTNDNGIVDSGEAAPSGITSPVTTPASGAYSYQNLPGGRDYLIDLENIVGYRVTSTFDPFRLQDLAVDRTDINFGIAPVSSAWYQTKDADIYANGNLVTNIPTQCTSPACSPYLSIVGAGGFPGVPIYGNTKGFGFGSVSQIAWIAKARYLGQEYTYAYFASRLPQTGVNNLGDVVNGTELATNAAASGFNWYSHTGDMNLNGAMNLGDKKVIIVTSGSVNITEKINLNKGRGFFMLVAGGNINIAPSVTNAGNPAIEGIYFAQGSINTGLSDSANRSRLIVRGMLVANNRVVLARNLDPEVTTGANNTTPAELIEFAPDLLLNFPTEFSRESTTWEEVAP